jgi:hypothetical protein
VLRNKCVKYYKDDKVDEEVVDEEGTKKKPKVNKRGGKNTGKKA